MAIGTSLLAGAAGGATVGIVIRAIDKFSSTFTKARAATLGLGVAFTALGIAGAVAVTGLTKMAGEFEQTQIAFSTMLGSAEKANELLKELADFAARTPFTITGVERNAKLLLAMSVETEKLLPTLKALGDVSAGLSVPLERIALNFGQVKVQGKLTGRELRDFSIAGVPLIAELAKNLNVSQQEVKDLVSAGKIGFPEVEAAFISMTSEGGKFFDLMEAQSKTLLGRISNIQDSFIKLSRIMGNIFLPAAKFVAESLAKILELAEQHPKIAKLAAVFLGVATALALIIGPITILLVLLPFIVTGLTAVSIAGLPVWLAAIAITAAFVGLIAIIVGVIAIFTTLKNNWTAFVVAMSMVWTDFTQGFTKMWFGIKIVVAKVWNGIVNIVLKSWNMIISSVEAGINAIIDLLNQLPFVNIQRVSLSQFKATLRNVGAIVSEIERERDLLLTNLDLRHQELLNNAAKLKLAEGATKEMTEQTKELTKQEQLVKDLSGFLFDVKTGDVFKRGGPLVSTEFENMAAFRRATQGTGMTINIENVQGLDPEEVARALDKLVRNQISI